VSTLMLVNIPLRTGRGGNNREHWAMAHRRNLQEQEAVAWYLHRASRKPPKPPVDVVLVRITPSAKGVDSDNLVASMKSVRDAVAKWFGVDDADEGAVRYECRQELGAAWGVRIEVHRFRC